MGNKTDIKPILSISMLISGKEDMGKSLESLWYFKRALSCEIILVDTGCDAEQRAMAERYADKVIDFVWCNDFAAARNAGLREAKGEWFLYLDDDEWFDNPAEIIKFFVSGECKKYNSATYKVRNYFGSQGKTYNETTATRIIRLKKNTVFVGKIHEYLYPFMTPTKNLSDFVHHYGYAFKDEEEKRKHAYRNIRPLIEMTKEEPEDIRWQCQLAQEYFALDDYPETVRICEDSLAWREKNKKRDEYDLPWVGAVYAFLLISLESQQEFKKDEQWLEKALAEPAMPEATRAFFFLAGIRLYSLNGLEEYEKCRNCAKEYIRRMQKMRNDKEAIAFGTSLITSAVFQEHRAYPALLLSMNALIRLEDYELAEEAFYLIDWSDRRMLRQDQQEKIIVDACCSVTYHPLWVRILQTLVSREDGMKEMYRAFLATEIQYKQLGEREKLTRLRRIVSELEFEDIYILCMQILWAEENPDFDASENRKEKLEELFGLLGEKYITELFGIRTEVWDAAQRYGISMEPALLRIDCGCWKNMLEDWLADADLVQIQKWDTRIGGWKKQPDIRYDLFAAKCMEGYLRHYREIGASLQQIEQILWKYADSVLAFYRNCYKEIVFGEMPWMFPEEAQLALKLKELQQYREQGNDRKSLECLRKCLGVYSKLGTVIDEYAKLCRNEIDRRSKEAEAAQTELVQIIQSLKQTARLRIEAGDFRMAREILIQIEQCSPGDEEVKELLERIPKDE